MFLKRNLLVPGACDVGTHSEDRIEWIKKKKICEKYDEDNL